MKAPDNLFQRKPGGPWWIRYSVNGREVRRSLKTKSIRQAKKLRDQILGKRTAAAEVRETFGLAAPADDGAPIPTVAEVAERFLTYEAGRGNKREVSARQLAAKVNNWAVPQLGADRLITSISFEDIEMFLGRLRRSKKKKGKAGTLGRSTVAIIFNATSRMFKYALRRGIVSANPCDLLEPGERPGKAAPRDEFLTWDEVARLLAELGDGQLADMVKVACLTGLRWGEICGLAFDDLALGGSPATLTPRRSYQGPLKNEASAGTIELHPDTAALLRRLEKLSSGPWVFPAARGGPYLRSPTNHRNRLQEAGKAAGLSKNVTPHLFRHSYGTHLYAATKDIHLVKRAMRHSDIKTTMAVYVKDTGASMAEAVAALPALAPRARLRSV